MQLNKNAHFADILKKYMKLSTLITKVDCKLESHSATSKASQRCIPGNVHTTVNQLFRIGKHCCLEVSLASKTYI